MRQLRATYGITKEQAAAGGNEDTPPVDGARRAKDGNWYVQKDGKYYRVKDKDGKDGDKGKKSKKKDKDKD